MGVFCAASASAVTRAKSLNYKPQTSSWRSEHGDVHWFGINSVRNTTPRLFTKCDVTTPQGPMSRLRNVGINCPPRDPAQ